jgi:hypothetical protein
MTKEEIIKLYGHGVCDAYGTQHCIGRCQDPKDCGARPIPLNIRPQVIDKIGGTEK